jgi:hypothetical protein
MLMAVTAGPLTTAAGENLAALLAPLDGQKRNTKVQGACKIAFFDVVQERMRTRNLR